MSNQDVRRLLDLADSALRQAEKLVEEDGEAYDAIGYALSAISSAEAELPLTRAEYLAVVDQRVEDFLAQERI
jgi:hypothetical protein